MSNKNGVLIICAHSDDQILGCGGTIAKYAKKGVPVYTVILSYGEKSHPHLKEKFVIKTRVKEAQEANKVVNGEQVFFLGLAEGKFEESFNETNASNKLKNIIYLHNISKIFTHSSIDIHIDHQATHKLIKDLTKNINVELYSFTVWNFFKNKSNTNKDFFLVVDTSTTFKQKIKSLSKFKSQKMQMSLPYIQCYINDFFNGLKYGYKFAEVFIKEK